MLIEFSVSNFKSIGEKVVLDLFASSLSEKPDNLIPYNRNLNLLKSGVIYGANASGKSTILQAIDWMKQLILTSTFRTNAEEPIKIPVFALDTNFRNKTSEFEIIFIKDETRFRYGFEIKNNFIYKEWLFSAKKVRERHVFTRTQDQIELSKQFLRDEQNLINKTRKNALFLSVAAQWNNSISQTIIQWFNNLNFIAGNNDMHYQFTVDMVRQNNVFKNNILALLKNSDIDISDIEVEILELKKDNLDKNLPSQFRDILFSKTDTHEVARVVTSHKIQNTDVYKLIKFDLNSSESEGTKKLFYLAGPLLDTLQNGKVLFVDELETSLHPLLIEKIVKLFNSKSNKNAQLIFTTHNTNLLNKTQFRRDQIWVVSKQYEQTKINALSDFKVRKDQEFESNYLAGKFGGIPILRN